MPTPTAEQRRYIAQQELKALKRCYQDALRNGHSFLGSDGQEHAIKMVGRNNRIIGQTDDEQQPKQPTRICKNKECRKEFVPNTTCANASTRTSPNDNTDAS
jgi:hypothetical protein